MSQDQKFFDTFNLVLGLLVGITMGIFFLSRYVGTSNQMDWLNKDPVYQQAIEDRIAPVGRVALAGDEAETEETGAVPAVAPVAEVLSGPQVYNQACLACHGAGIGGAPRVGEAADWTDRIAQGAEILNQHALEGYTGPAGYMPPKGGRVDLSDEEIIAAVDYMVEESQ